MRCRNSELPNPFRVDVAPLDTVPVTTARFISLKDGFCVRLTLDARRLFIVMPGPPPLVENEMLFPAAIDNVPVVDAAPTRETAFSPLMETVMAPAAVAV